VALLGTLKAGGAYVPIDPEYPEDRIAFMLEDASALLLTQEKLTKTLRIAEAARTTICLDTGWAAVRDHDDTALERSSTSADLAYVIYTSGSTGKPKGAMNAHRGICNRLLWMQDEYRLTESDVVLQKTPFSFDVSVWEFFWPLMTGARMVLAKPGGHRDNRYLVDLIERENVSVLHFVPSMLRLFLEEPDLERCASLRDVICSGEALPLELQQRFFKRLAAGLHNLYGPTEAAIDVTYWRCHEEEDQKTIPIGRPVANTTMYILDSSMQPVPIGQEGELHIGGVQVGRGYLNRPELTAERFVPDPFSSQADARLYKTGDLTRYLPDGNIEFLGRSDDQVKVRGNRVELGEIEHVASKHPEVKQCVVLAREDEPGDQRIVAYIVPAHESAPGPSELRSYLESRLPDFMVPSTFVTIDTVPLNSSGKVDRRALPAPDRSRPDLDQNYVAPRGELEIHLAALWSDILDLEKVGTHDRFFELGGTSLQAARFINRLQKDLGEFVYVVTVFDNPTIAEYARFLRNDYENAVREIFPGDASGPGQEVWEARSSAVARITADDVERMKAAIPTLAPDPVAADTEPMNRPALFILAPPRSGTTLLRVMLAGHPGLFAAAELQLLGFSTLVERREAFTEKYAVWLEGTVRSIMEILGCDAAEAKGIMAEHEDRGVSTKAFYAVLQDWLGGRMLIDKSPAYATDLNALRKAETDFADALYIHLVRHPYSMVRSFESYHMDQILYLRKHPYTPRQLGELIWTISQQNILQFFEEVPKERQIRISFEDLVTDPVKAMREMCQQLSIEYHEGLTQPYEDTERKMTDGIYTESTPMGDTRFLEHQRIKPEMADTWKAVLENDFLGDVTWRTAERLGYERPGDQRRARRGRESARRRRTSGRGRS
jgi:amino acid adenylation domain-containing protein